MTVYVVTQPDPPPGTDFSFVVPGRYTYDVTGITATLTAGGGSPTVAVDASGHGLDGTYHSAIQPITFVPGLVAGDLALFTGPVGNSAVAGVDVPQGVIGWNNDFSFALWISETPTANSPWVIYQSRTFVGLRVVTIVWDEADSNKIKVGGDVNTVWESPPNVLPDDGSTHFLAFIFSGGVLTLYMDNVVVPWAITGAPVAFPHPPYSGGLAFEASGNVAGAGIMDELALWNYAITAGDVGTMFAAATVSFAAYTAAVLALSPVEYYHLDDVAPVGGRQPSLVVSDGTTELEAIPTGFPAVATPGPYEYSWQPRLNADTQSTDGTLTTVAIPRLLLPAGYTVGARTLDLQSADQWSKVTLWWDDAYQEAVNPSQPWEYPPGALLKFVQSGG